MTGRSALEGRLLELSFGEQDATPDLHEAGTIVARVTGVTLEGSPPSPRIQATVEGPDFMEGLRATLGLRYEGETVEQALAGRPVAVTVVFEKRGGTVVGGGLGMMEFRRG